MRISDWSSDVCSSDLPLDESATLVGSNPVGSNAAPNPFSTAVPTNSLALNAQPPGSVMSAVPEPATWAQLILGFGLVGWLMRRGRRHAHVAMGRSEEHTSELQSLMRISYAVFCLKKKKTYSAR